MNSQAVPFPLGATDLADALARGEIVAYFQPQIDVATGQIVAVETLSRWRHPHRGIIGPGEFIPLAERTGLIHLIGELMIEEGCRCAAEWQRRGHPLEISINVSAAQLSTPQFFERVVSTLDRMSVPAGCLTLEITESQAIRRIGPVREHLDQLRQRGIGISIDDFGTGHSSIERLLRLGATELKFDRTLIQSGTHSTRALIAAIVSLVHERNIRVVAEGIETVEHLALARELRFDRGQGFLFAHPTSGELLEELVSANRASEWAPGSAS